MDWFIAFGRIAGEIFANNYSVSPIIEHSGIVITADSIKTKLLDMETDVDKTGSAFISKVISKKISKKYADSAQSDTKKEIHCYKCKQSGHYKNQCPNAKIISNKSDNKSPNVFSVVFLTGQFNKDDWYGLRC